jgi:hypothetical protein
MNGKDAEPARLLTHFESDYGAAPSAGRKVEMKLGQKVTKRKSPARLLKPAGLLI